jgi:hypothetical protein
MIVATAWVEPQKHEHDQGVERSSLVHGLKQGRTFISACGACAASP